MDPSNGHEQIMSNNNNNNQSLESMLGCTSSKPDHQQVLEQDQKKARPQPEQALKCPRCDSTNTKFCYYNNYSLSQPRYFCKSCRRYWTKGGTLRNVPVGGGCRKNKRSSSSSTKRAQDHQLPFNPLINSLPPLSSYDSEFTLALARLQKQTYGVQLGLDDGHHDLTQQQQQGFLDALRSNNNNGFNNNMNMQNDLYYGGGGDDMMIPYDHQQEMSSVETTQAVTVTTIKQELCNVGGGGGGGREQSDNCNGNNNKVLWGFPWQINGDTTNMLGDIADLSSSRASWNLTTTPSWHGLLNSPLM